MSDTFDDGLSETERAQEREHKEWEREEQRLAWEAGALEAQRRDWEEDLYLSALYADEAENTL